MEPVLSHAGVTFTVGGHVVSVSLQPEFTQRTGSSVDTPDLNFELRPDPNYEIKPTPSPSFATSTAAPTANDRVQKLLDLLIKFGPFILSILKLFGLKANPAEIADALKAFHALQDFA